MNPQDIRRMVALAPDRYLDEARDWRPRRPYWLRVTAMAACLCLVAGLGTALALTLWTARGDASGSSGDGLLFDSSGSSGSSGSEADASDNEPIGVADVNTFMSYAGPLLPLTLETANDSITAERALTYDFSGSWTTEGIAVTDCYTLTNTSGESQTVTLLYPFVETLDEVDAPVLTLDGETVEATLSFGGRAGGYTGVWDEDGLDDSTYNLDEPDCWTDYQSLLSDGSYQADALYGDWSVEGTVVVYWFTDAEVLSGESDAAALALSAQIDSDATTVYSYGINGRGWDPETGDFSASYFVQEGDESRLRCLIVVGEDFTDYTLQGYEDGGCTPGTEMEITATVTREETTWAELLDTLTADYWTADEPAHQRFLRGVCECLLRYGGLSGSTADRYEDGRLEELFLDTLVCDRVFYAAVTVTVPAGESVTLTARLTQAPSYDYGCDDSGRGLRGFDLLTSVGSNLTFTGLTAALVNAEDVELVMDSYGFDPINADGFTQAVLDPTCDRYFLGVRSLSGEEEN